ncbi:MAG: phosphoribosyltransferase family protein [Candidatus Gracilibacteria bacterium]|nr:phosphoribosyltransferase family protein [Candidatus Gracilibacteria bacterium]
MFKFLLDIFAPKKCYSCNKEGNFLCEKCLSNMSNFSPICYVCKDKSNNFEVHKNCQQDVYYDKIILLSHYKNIAISKLIKDLKFYQKRDISEDFGLYLSRLFLDNEIYKNTDDYIIVFPPMGFIKKLKRGYNHSELMAKIVSKDLGIKIESKLIKKVKKTRQQSKLNKEERMNNLNDSFILNDKKIINKHNKIVIIIDDVISTGSTINEMSKLFKKSGYKKIIGLIIASD